MQYDKPFLSNRRRRGWWLTAEEGKNVDWMGRWESGGGDGAELGRVRAVCVGVWERFESWWSGSWWGGQSGRRMGVPGHMMA